MTSKQVFMVLTSVILLLVIGLGVGAYSINSMLAKQSDELTSLKATSQALSTEQNILKRDKKDIKNYASLNQIAKAIVPQDKNQAEAVREIVNLATKNGITLASITFPASTLTAPTSTNSGSSANLTTPQAVNPKIVKLSQLIPIKSLPGVYELIINVQSSGDQTVPYNNFISFLNDLEHNRRTAQISNIAITPDNKSKGNLTFTLNLVEYIKP